MCPLVGPKESRTAMLTRRDKNFVWRRVDARSLDLEGMKVAIVGGTGGIGRALSRFMVSRGAAVLVVGQTFRDADVPGIEFIKADLSLMREARRVGSLLPAETLDLVIFTTGIFAAPKRQETAEGIERDMAVSYLSRLVGCGSRSISSAQISERILGLANRTQSGGCLAAGGVSVAAKCRWNRLWDSVPGDV